MNKRHVVNLFLIAVLLSSCSTFLPADVGNPIPTDSSTSLIQPTLTPRPAATRTPLSSSTALPKPTLAMALIPSITPFTPVKPALHALSLNAISAKEIQMLSRIGSGRANSLAWSPDGRLLAVASGLGIYFYDGSTFNQVSLLDTNGPVMSLAFSPDATQIAAGTADGVSIWGAPYGGKLLDLPGQIKGQVWKIVWGVDGFLAAEGQNSSGKSGATMLHIWQADTGELTYSSEATESSARHSFDFSPDGKTLLMARGDERGGFKLLKAYNGVLVGGASQNSSSAIFNGDGQKVFLISGGNNPVTKLYDLGTAKSVNVLEDYKCLGLSHNGPVGLCYTKTDMVAFDLVNGQVIRSLKAGSSLSGGAIRQDWQFAATLDVDTVKIWDINSGASVKDIFFDSMSNVAIGLASLKGNDQYLAATSTGGLIEVWDLATSKVLRQLWGSDYPVTGVAFSPDRLSLGSVDEQDALWLWDLQQGIETYTFTLQAKKTSGPLVFSPDGSKLAMLDFAGKQNSPAELDLYTGKPTSQGDSSQGHPFAYNSSGHLMSWEYLSNQLVLTDLSTREQTTIAYNFPSSSPYPVTALALSPDAQFLAAGLSTSQIFVWDLRASKLVMILQTPQNTGATAQYLVFNPQGDLLVSISSDRSARLWDVASGAQLTDLGQGEYAAFTPDARLLVLSLDGVLRLWGIAPWP